MSTSSNPNSNPNLDKKRHSFAHILAAVIKQMFPEAQMGVGPVIENGCYYDFVLPRTLIPEDLPLIENHIKELLNRKLVMRRQEVSIEEAIALFANNNQPLKVELLNDLLNKGTTSLKAEEKDGLVEQPLIKSLIVEKSIQPELLESVLGFAEHSIIDQTSDFGRYYEFVLSEDRIDDFANIVSISLMEGKWYAEIGSKVIFKNFVVDLSNQNGEEDAIKKGLSIGIPTEQLDFLSAKKYQNTKTKIDFIPQSKYFDIFNELGEKANVEGYKKITQNNINIGHLIEATDDCGDTIASAIAVSPEGKFWFFRYNGFLETGGSPILSDQCVDREKQSLYLGENTSVGLDRIKLLDTFYTEDKKRETKFLQPLFYIELSSDEAQVLGSAKHKNYLTGEIKDAGFMYSIGEVNDLLETWSKEEIIDQVIIDALKKNYNLVAQTFEQQPISSAPTITLYRLEDQETGEDLFVDLCRGPHIESTSELKDIGFKLDKFSAAYWRGDQERNVGMQRIYALIFENQTEIDKFIEDREEAKKRDHRVLGEQMELFTFSEIVGKGLPLWLEKGATIKRILERFIVEEEIRRGYRHVETPDMARLALYEKSGHFPYYKDSMYAPIEIDGDKFMLRPMTCPHHFQIYLKKPRTYKELPMRIAELAKLYRYEDSGALTGLTRVRCFCLADSHIICTPEQANSEAKKALDLIEYCAEVFGLTKNVDYRYELSLGDREDEKKYFKDDQAWDFAEGVLRSVLVERQEDFVELKGEAAFYGPKIDIQMKSITGKESTAFTVQYDFVMPKRFNLNYFDQEQSEKEAVVIHRSSIGALERVFAFLTEFYTGRFPFWLAPTQVKILTINDKVLPYIDQIKSILDNTVLMKPLKYNEVRYEIDNRSENLGKKIREAEMEKIPVILIVGPKDMEAGQVSVRTQNGESKIALGELKDFLHNM